jgi:hypothetical protein
MDKKPNTHVKCDICGREFVLNKNVLTEQEITLQKEDLKPHKVRMTFLTCPCCGKEYPVIMDDETTLPLLDKLQVILSKQVKQVKRGFNPSPELARKKQQLNWKLDFKRQKLAEKYNGSFYQLEDGTQVQLDYRYRTR